MLCVKAYYWRGMAKLKMQNTKGIIDVNQSLALNPRLLQVIIILITS